MVLREDAPCADTIRDAFARAVADGLRGQPKSLPATLSYGPATAGLRDEIRELPDYYLARAERQILASHAAEIAARFRDAPPLLVELGAGDIAAVRLLISSLLTRHGQLRHVTIDDPGAGLEDRAQALVDEYPRLEATCVASVFERGPRELRRLDGRPRVILWLGSTIGRFDRAAATNALHDIGETMRADDVLLVGIDLRKDARALERAYNDASKLMAQKSLAALTRVNEEFGADFDTSRFRHQAAFAVDPGRVELHLVSRLGHVVTIGALDMTVRFEKGEALLTEVAYKYSPSEIDAVAGAAGLVVQDRWYDREGRFSMNLMRHVPAPARRA